MKTQPIFTQWNFFFRTPGRVKRNNWSFFHFHSRSSRCSQRPVLTTSTSRQSQLSAFRSTLIRLFFLCFFKNLGRLTSQQRRRSLSVEAWRIVRVALPSSASWSAVRRRPLTTRFNRSKRIFLAGANGKVVKAHYRWCPFPSRLANKNPHWHPSHVFLNRNRKIKFFSSFDCFEKDISPCR